MSTEELCKVVDVLKKEWNVSPTKIASEIGSDRRTVSRILQEGEKLKIFECDLVEISESKCASCTLAPEYSECLRKKSKRDQN